MNRVLSLFVICFLLELGVSTEVAALSLGGKDNKAPFEIEAENGVVCAQDNLSCTAFGPVVVTRGTSILKSQKLIVYFKTISDKAQEVSKLEILGDVVFSDKRGGVKATGKYGVYNAELGRFTLQGNPIIKDNKTTLYGGNQVVFYENSQMATTHGRSTVAYEDKLIQANVIKVYFKKSQSGSLAIERLEIEGNVIISTPHEIAKAKRGVYRADIQVAELFDNVTITRKEGQISGNYGRYDMKTGQGQLYNRVNSEYTKNRVQAILLPSNNTSRK